MSVLGIFKARTLTLLAEGDFHSKRTLDSSPVFFYFFFPLSIRAKLNRISITRELLYNNLRPPISPSLSH